MLCGFIAYSIKQNAISGRTRQRGGVRVGRQQQGGRRGRRKELGAKRSRSGAGRRAGKAAARAGRRSGRRFGRQEAVSQLYGAPSDAIVDSYGAPGNQVDHKSAFNHVPITSNMKLFSVLRLVSPTSLATGQAQPQTTRPSTREAAPDRDMRPSRGFQTGQIGVGRGVRGNLCRR